MITVKNWLQIQSVDGLWIIIAFEKAKIGFASKACSIEVNGLENYFWRSKKPIFPT